MKVDKTSKIIIHLSAEEVEVLENTLDLLLNIDREINNPDVDEVDFDNGDKELMQNLFNELEEINPF